MTVALDGAFTVGGGEWNYGQTMSEDLGKSMFMLPDLAPENIMTILRLALERLPLDALKVFQPIFGLAEEVFNNVGGAVGAIIDALIVKPLGMTLDMIVDLLKGLFPWIPWDSIPETLEDIWQWILDGIHAIPFFGDFITGAETFVEAFIRNVIYYLTHPGEILTALGSAIMGMLTHGGEMIQQIIQGFLYWLGHPGELLTGLINWLKDIFGNAGELLHHVFDGFLYWLSHPGDLLTGLINWLKGIFGNAGELLHHVIEGVIYWITHPGAPGGIGYLLMQALQGLFTGAGFLVQSVVTAIIDFFKKIGIDFSGPLSFMQQIVDNVARFFGQTGETLFHWASSLVNFDNLGKMIQGMFGSIFSIFPISMVNTAEKVNLLNMGVFQTASSLEGSYPWSWDSSRNRTGTIGGTAKCDCTGATTRTLYSNQNIRVAAGDRIAASTFVYTVGFNGAAGSIQLVAIPFAGTVQQGEVLLASRGASNSAWAELTNQSAPYEITAASGITSIQLALRVTSSATAGGVWWDDITLWKTGLMKQGLVEYLISAWNGLIGGLGVAVGGSPSPASTTDPWNFTLQAGAGAKGQANTALTNASSAQSTANSASTSASSAVSTANSAQSTATTANGTANSAWYAANGAQSSANTAQTSANNAQSTANTANTAASNATSVANNAVSTATAVGGRVDTSNNKLFGSTNPATGATILPANLPSTVAAVGSGVLLSRSNAGVYALNWSTSSGFQGLPYGFYNSASANTSDLVRASTGSTETIRATNAGWYQVELCYKLYDTVQYAYWWNFTPAIYESRTGAYKYGTSTLSPRDVYLGGSFSMTPSFAAASFIVYMNANDYIQAGFTACKENNGTGSNQIIGPCAPSNTYFSMALLNRSLA